jgi:hypothetical protein
LLEAERVSSRDARRGKDTAEKELLTRKDAERRGKMCSASVSKPKSVPGTKLDAKKPVTGPADHDNRPERRREPHGNPTRWRVVVEYDLNGRRVERKTLAPPPSARGRPAWSSATRPGTSSGPAASRSAHNAKHKNETASKALRPATSAGVSRPASRPAFDPGPGGLGIDHRAITEKFSRASKYAFLTPRRERRADASRRVRSPETRSPVRYRRATPSPAPPRRRRDPRGPRDPRDLFFVGRRRTKRREAETATRRRDVRTVASRRDGFRSELEFDSELDSERDVDEGGRKRAKERRATHDGDGDGDGGVFGRNPKHPKHPNPFVDVRDAAGDDSDSEAVFFSSTGLGTGGAIRERFVGDSGRPATARSRVRTPSTSGRRAALGGFEGYGSAFGYRSHARRSHSSSQEIARRPYTADTAVPRRDENEARGFFDSNDSNESSSFDDIINRAFGMAHAPSPSRFAERRRGVTTEAFSGLTAATTPGIARESRTSGRATSRIGVLRAAAAAAAAAAASRFTPTTTPTRTGSSHCRLRTRRLRMRARRRMARRIRPVTRTLRATPGTAPRPRRRARRRRSRGGRTPPGLVAVGGTISELLRGLP